MPYILHDLNEDNKNLCFIYCMVETGFLAWLLSLWCIDLNEDITTENVKE